MASEVSWIGRSLSLSHDSENRNAADADVSRNRAVPMLLLNGCGSAWLRACSDEEDADVSLFSCCNDGRGRLSPMLFEFRQDGSGGGSRLERLSNKDYCVDDPLMRI